MSRPARAFIDLAALARNYGVARSQHGGRTLAILKADAYGHGAVQCAHHLAPQADGFGVAFGEEAAALRESGIQSPILVLEGFFSEHELQQFHQQRLWTVVHHEEQLQMLEHARLPAKSLDVWLKVDTGMRRAGFGLAAIRSAHARLSACVAVNRIVLMTHFARADELDVDMTRQQIHAFDTATQHLAGDRSLCNSAGILAWPGARRDWGRCGIALYGASPLAQPRARLSPVMRLESEIFAVRDILPGDCVGYGGSFTADRPMRIGLVAMGYADGYPRAAGNGTAVGIDGARSTIVGRVSMDMLAVDLTELPGCGISSKVEFWGENIAINEVAARAQTISYELLCNVKRVRKVYTGARPGQ
ncbi:alanine racemase [Pantoea sp. 18069]|uniref:alanine racemase n=1 Tax=Pantoea sp. 18069 TaxID=2681415 RepID=UPI00135B87E0|nr:alanine racemase [Pantoea sp. 18069]